MYKASVSVINSADSEFVRSFYVCFEYLHKCDMGDQKVEKFSVSRAVTICVISWSVEIKKNFQFSLHLIPLLKPLHF